MNADIVLPTRFSDGASLPDEEILLKFLHDNIIRPLRVHAYPDGAPLIEFPEDYSPITMLVRPKTMGTFLAVMWFAEAVTMRGGRIDLVLPLVPGSRQDRLNPRRVGDYLFTLKSVARLINAVGFGHVTVLDPHSDVTAALIDRCEVVSIPIGALHGYAGIIAPDGGAEKRAQKVATQCGLPLYHAWKTRDVTTGHISGFGHGDLGAGDRFLIVDDLCDGGGTFIGLADKLIDRYGPLPSYDLYVTHGLFTQGVGQLEKRFGHIYTTDSVIRPFENEAVTVLNVCGPLLTGEH